MMRLKRLAVVAVCLITLVLSIPCLGGDTITMNGTVVDMDGDPVGGVKVFAVKRWVGAEFHVGVKATAMSGEDGRFALKPLPKPERDKYYFLVAFTPDKWLGWSWRSIRQEANAEEDFEITVSKCCTVEGRVTDDEGNPLAGASVQHKGFGSRGNGSRGNLSFLGRSSRGQSELEAVVRFNPAMTDSEGNYVLTSVPMHVDVSPHATRPGYYHQLAGHQDPKDVRMVRAGSIVGRLVNKRGKRVPGVTMHAREARGGGFSTTATGADGSFRFADVPPGKFSVWVDPHETLRAKAAQKMHVRVGETTRIEDMLASRGVFITGRLLDADTGKPITGMRVAAIASEVVASEKVDEAGRYKLRVAPEDTYTVSCQGGNPSYLHDREANRTVDVGFKGVRDIDIRVKKAEIARGKVVDQEGIPVPGASVWVGLPGGFAKTDADGSFEVRVPDERWGPG